MPVMRVAPEGIGREGQDADDSSEPVIGATASEIGAVTAIMLDGEELDEDAAGDGRKQKGEPPFADLRERNHRGDQRDIDRERDRRLRQRAFQIGALECLAMLDNPAQRGDARLPGVGGQLPDGGRSGVCCGGKAMRQWDPVRWTLMQGGTRPAFLL